MVGKFVSTSTPGGRGIGFSTFSEAFCPLCLFVSSIVGGALIDDYLIIAYFCILAHICSMFAVFVRPIGRHHNSKGILHQVCLDNSVIFSGSRQRWRRVDLDQPRLQLIVDQDVITIHFEAMLVIYDDILHRFQRDVYYVVDVIEALISLALAHGLLQVEPEIGDRPF